MSQWEYKTEVHSGYDYLVDYEDVILNNAASDGWELVQIRDATYDLQSRVVFTFKRKVGSGHYDYTSTSDDTETYDDEDYDDGLNKRERYKTFK